ncbi:UPF0489 protein C5orf22 homolog [Ostrea edulis]|uniref:UPF0489 protein C5orf22 homolog n=1 Tax=Ostrea edulis TaxID=37623 RepID=UPI0024AF6CDC|nr:UPF0489 protein C5orf22 homolog [Ostrea edulis]
MARIPLSSKASLRKISSLPINVYIIEEHHEAIPYWFESSAGNLTEKKGLTLIHIDGHSDMGLPQYFRKFPYMRWPKNRKELDYYMQANDQFILSAAMSGIFSKVVWVWPRWDQKNHESESREVVQISIGWLMVDTAIPKIKRKTFCLCYHRVNDIQKTSSGSKKREDVNCRRLPTALENEDDFPEGVKIDFKTCKSKKTFIYEEIREDLAPDIFRRKGNEYRENGVILDIDEDFFGCTYASQIMLDAGITEEEFRYINEILGRIFCPNNAKEETATDNILMKVLDDIILSDCFAQDVKGDDCQKKEVSIYEKYIQTLNKDNENLLCRNTFKQDWNKKELVLLLQSIMKKSLTQIMAIKHVGFCSTTSTARGLDMTKSSEFNICIGANTPNRSMIIEHHTNLYEIRQRTMVLEEIFETLKPSLLPSMITLCRSSRDGYVPRELQNLIEGNIIESFKSLSPTKLNYDTELLGGREGWLKSRGFWYVR